MTSKFENAINRALAVGHQTAGSNNRDPLELVVGPYRCGKTIHVIDELIDSCRENPFASALVIVPSQRYRTLFETRLQERLKQRLGNGALPGIVGLQILPFYKACEHILRKAGIPFQLIPEQVRTALISQVVTELKSEGSIQTLEPIIGFSGTHSALLELIDELQRAALLPDQIIAKLEETAQSEARFVELAKIYDRYCDHLSNLQYLDERGLAFAARSVLNQKQLPFSMAMVTADGFDRFNRLQLQVLEGLSRHAAKTRICFDYIEPERDPSFEYSWKDTSYAELSSVFPEATVRKVDKSPELLDPQERHTFRALDRFFEAAEVARLIKQQIVDGASPGQFLIVARGISVYGPAVRAAFEGAGINYFLDESVAIDSLPVVQSVSRLFQLATRDDFRRNSVIAALRSPHCKIAAFENADRDLNKLDRMSLDENVVGSVAQWENLLVRREDKFSPEFAAAFRAFLADVQPPGLGTFRDFIVWCEDLLDKYFVFATDNGDDQFQRWEEHRAIGEVRRCFASLLHEQNICGEISCTPEYFLNRLRLLVEHSNFRRLPRHSDYVTICSADLAPNKLYRDVFILGMAEGEFPRRSRQSGFLSVDEVSGWLSFGIDIRNPRFHAAFEPALFNSLIQRAQGRVHLSCPMFDTSGEELLASYLITGGDEEMTPTNEAPFHHSDSAPVSARDALSGLLWRGGNTDITDLRSMLPLTTLVESLAEPLYNARARQNLGNGVINGDLRELVATGAMPVSVPAQWSASKLNDYGKCPFRYWLTHALKIEPQEEPEAKLHPLVLGETYHKAMELFYQTMLARKLNLADLDWETASKIFQGAINAALALLDQRPDVRQGEFWRYERNEIVFRLKRFFLKEHQRAQHDQDRFVPVMTEASFGLPDPLSHPPVKVRNGGKEIIIRGRIDRVDVTEATMGSQSPRVRVIDYKTGSSPITKDDALSGRNIQLPLYALAVQRSILPGSKVAIGQYLGVNAGEPTGRLSFEPSEKQPESIDMLDKVQEHVRNFVNGIASGDFSVKPNHKSVCSNCVHTSVCRVGELPEPSRARSMEAQ